MFVVLALIAAACSGGEGEEASADLITDTADSGQVDAGVADAETVDDGNDSLTVAGASVVIERVPVEETITVAVVNSPTMSEIIALSNDFFTAPTGINVVFEQFDQQIFREDVTSGHGARRYDVIVTSPFTAPQWGQNGWLINLSSLATEDSDYNVGDIITSVGAANSFSGDLYALPFYAESSFIMFNQQIMNDNNIDFPDNPTWEDVAEIASIVHTDDIAGICLRGRPAWDQLGASLTTVVNTFGGTWWETPSDDDYLGEAQINQPDSGFRAAAEFYVDLARNYGPDDAANQNFNECLEQFQNGEVAIWYDSTVAASILEADDSPVAGNVGYALAPTGDTHVPSGWLWTWGLAIPNNAPHFEAAWDYIRWATSAETARLIGENSPDGWAAAAPAARLSSYEIPEFLEANDRYADITLESITNADPNNPGTTTRPGLPGVQYVGIPEFENFGSRCARQFSDAIAGDISTDEALDRCQTIASEVSQ